MLKYKHLFLTGLLAAIVGLFAVAYTPQQAAAVDNWELQPGNIQGDFRWTTDAPTGEPQILGLDLLIDGWGAGQRYFKKTSDTTYSHTSEGSIPVKNADNNTVICRDVTLIITVETASAASISANVPEQSHADDTTTCRTKIAKSAISITNPAFSPPELDGSTNTGGGGKATSSCAINAIGWLICPVVNFVSAIVDGLYGMLESLFLITEPLSTDTGSATFKVWAQIRNIANLAFILAFIIIVFSHVSSLGLSNYHIKKMLPRLIIAAILVNISYWVCAIAIDVSNILGAHSKSIFDEVINVDSGTTRPVGSGPGPDSFAWTAFAATVVIGGTALVSIGVFFPILITALAALVTVVAVLLMREALILLLVVISPLAFVAFLLPNTEGLFNKWRQLLTVLLLMYPIIGAIVGGSRLASQIIMAGSEGDEMRQMVGAAISVIPLFITPVVMKTAGGVLNRFAGMVNDTDKGVFDNLRRRSDNYREAERDRKRESGIERGRKLLDGEGKLFGKKGSRRRRGLAAVMSGGNTSRIAVEQRRRGDKARADEKESLLHAERAINEVNKDEHGESIGGGYAARVARGEDGAESIRARAQATVDRQAEEDIKEREILLRAKFDSTELLSGAKKAMETAIAGNDAVGARAAQSILLNSGAPGLERIEEVIEEAERNGTLSSSKETAGAIRRGLNSAGLKGRNNALAVWSYDENLRDLETIKVSPETYNGLSDKELLGQSAGTLERVAGMTGGPLDAERATRILNTDSLKGEFTKSKTDALNSVLPSPTQAQPAPQPQAQVQPQPQAQASPVITPIATPPSQPAVPLPSQTPMAPQSATLVPGQTPVPVSVVTPLNSLVPPTQDPVPIPTAATTTPSQITPTSSGISTPGATHVTNITNSSSDSLNNIYNNSNYTPANARISPPSGSSNITQQTDSGLLVPRGTETSSAPTTPASDVNQRINQIIQDRNNPQDNN